MKRLLASVLLLTFLISAATTGWAKSDDFDATVRVIEQFYQVKHKGIPFLARAGIKTAKLAARVAGGKKKRIAEAGSVRVAYFEGQQFKPLGGAPEFRRRLKSTLVPNWLPFIQVLSPNDEEQTYIFLRDAGPKYTVLVVTIDKDDGSVVQVTLKPETLAMLMQHPEVMGKEITDEALIADQE